jgi:hypothetical protein
MNPFAKIESQIRYLLLRDIRAMMLTQISTALSKPTARFSACARKKCPGV